MLHLNLCQISLYDPAHMPTRKPATRQTRFTSRRYHRVSCVARKRRDQMVQRPTFALDILQKAASAEEQITGYFHSRVLFFCKLRKFREVGRQEFNLCAADINKGIEQATILLGSFSMRISWAMANWTTDDSQSPGDLMTDRIVRPFRDPAVLVCSQHDERNNERVTDDRPLP